MNGKEAYEDDLFQRSNFVHVNNNDQQEEDEDLEDQKRRQEELQNLIANAFDDIEFDDANSTNNSTCNQSTDTSKFQPDNLAEDTLQGNSSFQNLILSPERCYSHADLNSLEQLQILYQVRVKENKELSKQLADLKKNMKEERDLCQRKKMLLEADNEKLTLSLRQSQNVLMEKNDQLNYKIKEISQLNELLNDLKNSNEENEEKLRFWKNTADELQQKLNLIEKNINKNISENQIKSRYEKEINDLQNALGVSNNKLEILGRDYKNLQCRLEEIEYTKGLLIAEKNQMVNSITATVQNSQEHCQTLLNKVDVLQLEKQRIQNELSVMQNKLVDVEKEQLKSNNKEEMIMTLQDELRRSLEAQTQKRDEIIKLENTIKELKSNEITLQEELKSERAEQENIKKKYDTLLSENSNLKLNNLQLKIESEGTTAASPAHSHEENLQDKIYEKDEYEKLAEKLNILEQELEESKCWKNRYMGCEEQCLKLQELVTQLRSEQSDKEEYKVLTEKLNILEQEIEESKSWKSRYVDCEEQCLKLQELVVQLRLKQSDLQVTINNLTEKLALKDERDTLIDILKKKATIFEDYIAKKPSTVDKIVDTLDLNLQDDNSTTTDSPDNSCRSRNDIKQNDANVNADIDAKKLQINALTEENKFLKDKLIFDRDAYAKLSDMWTEELQRLSEVIESLRVENTELAKTLDELKIKDKQYEVLHNDLNSQVENIKHYVHVIKVVSKHQQDRLIYEYDHNTKKIRNVLKIIEQVISKDLLSFEDKLKKKTEEIETLYENKIKNLRNSSQEDA